MNNLEYREYLANKIDAISDDEYMQLLKHALHEKQYSEYLTGYMAIHQEKAIINLAEEKFAEQIREWIESIPYVSQLVTDQYIQNYER